jgi:hemolysin activation/secretion protein
MKIQITTKFILLLFSGLSVFTLPGYALPTAPLPDAGLILRQNRDVPVAPNRPGEALIEKPEQTKPPMKPESSQQVVVKNFVFSGNTRFSNAELQSLLTRFTGRSINFTDLQSATAVITKHYRDAGYFVALAYLPAQSIKKGTVEIAVLEGYLDDSHKKTDAINLIGNTRINKKVLQRFLDTQKPGSVVTEKNMSRLSLLINDIPGLDAKTVISPGSKTGTSAISLKVKEGPLVTGYVSTDNYGLYATGYYRFDGGISLNDLTGFGDQLNLRAQTTDSGNTVAGWADYNIPVNGYGTRLAFNFSELHYTLGRAYTPLDADGLARTIGATVLHPLLLSTNSRLTGIAHYEHRWMNSNINLFNEHNDRELDIMSFSFAGHLFDKLLAAGGLTQGYVNVSAGSVDITNAQAFAIDTSRQGLHTSGGYHKFNWQLNRTQNIIAGFSLYTNFQGQVASKNLDSSEQISLGGPFAIRAYPVGEGSGSEGWMFNAESRYRFANIPYVPGYLQAIAFIDTGNSRINTNPIPAIPQNSRQLTGFGFGINWLEVKGVNIRTSIAWRDSKKQPTSDPSQQGPMMYFQLTKIF